MNWSTAEPADVLAVLKPPTMADDDKTDKPVAVVAAVSTTTTITTTTTTQKPTKIRRRRRSIVGMPKRKKKKMAASSSSSSSSSSAAVVVPVGQYGIAAPMVWQSSVPPVLFPGGAVGAGIAQMRLNYSSIRYSSIHVPPDSQAFAKFAASREQHLAEWLEEKWMYHGTTTDRVDSIFANGFAVNNGSYGVGVYISDKLATARSYAVDRGNFRKQRGCIIACRVLYNQKDQTGAPTYVMVKTPDRILPVFAVTYQ